MKLATFEVPTKVGPVRRIGAVMGPEDDRFVDLTAASARMLADRGDGRAGERAAFLVPPDMAGFGAGGAEALRMAQDALAHARGLPQGGEGALGPRGETLLYRRDEVHLLAPIPHPHFIRDFAGFERHLKKTFGDMGFQIPESWYRRPLCFMANPGTVIPPESEILWPGFTRKLDYELEICAVIGVPGRDIPVERAREHILGFTILNDFSARDIQPDEMAMRTGPFKSKSWAWGLGPWILTQDEIPNPGALHMAVRVNGETWAKVVPEDMYWTFEEMVAYTSTHEELRPGDIFGSGTVSGGCGMEINRWLKPGDVVELEIEKIGVLRHRIGHPQPTPASWVPRG